jgi:hypothetical protein
MRIGYSSSSNSGCKEYHWCWQHSPGTVSIHIWTPFKELKAQRDGNGAEIVAPVQEVAKTVSSNSLKWIFDIGRFPYLTLDRNWFESILSVRSNVILAQKTQVEYTGIGSVCVSGRLASGDISVVLLYSVLFVLSS